MVEEGPRALAQQERRGNGVGIFYLAINGKIESAALPLLGLASP